MKSEDDTGIHSGSSESDHEVRGELHERTRVGEGGGGRGRYIFAYVLIKVFFAESARVVFPRGLDHLALHEVITTEVIVQNRFNELLVM